MFVSVVGNTVILFLRQAGRQTGGPFGFVSFCVGVGSVILVVLVLLLVQMLLLLLSVEPFLPLLIDRLVE